MKKWILSFLVLFMYSLRVSSQQPATYNSSDIFLQLKKLNVLGSVLYVAAHPDDENTRLLAFMAREKMYRTGYLSLTRGDGGQNLIGNEQGIELGLIRTQELLAARRIDGAEQFFTRAYDFGYSKSADEAMRIWDKEKVLADVVWVIRKFQPDVIITRFPGDERAGHGHHTASALLANEAFEAAADPAKFTDQFAHGVKPWKAKRILWNSFNFGGNNTTSNDQFKVDVGAFNPLLGKGYGEIASESRSQHKSQGFGVARQRGQQLEYFTPTGGEAPVNDLFDNINTSWSRIEGGAAIQQQVQQILNSYSFTNPQASVSALVQLHRSIKVLPQHYWTNKKLQEIEQLIEACSGLFAEAVTVHEYGVQGDSIRFSYVLNNRSGLKTNLKSIALLKGSAVVAGNKVPATGSVKDTVINKQLPANQNMVMLQDILIDEDVPVSQPYWVAAGLKGGYFDVKDQTLVGRPDIVPAFIARFVVNVEGVDLVLDKPLQYKHTDPVKGELYQPLTILPKVVVSATPTVVLANVKPATSPKITVAYTSNVNAQQVPASLTVHNGRASDLFEKRPLDLKKGNGGSFSYPLQKMYHAGQGNNLDHSLVLQVKNKEQKFGLNHKAIRYDHIPDIHYFYHDQVKVIDAEVKTAGKKIGYIAGAGDRVAEALELMGYEVTRLGENDITAANLVQFDAVVTGIRAYNVHEFLSSKYNDLMIFVKNGGNLIVQYNTNNQIGPVRAQISPYPLTITRNRVTDEASPVRFDIPNHPVLNYPNKITLNDFEGWIQERSIYHAETSDTNYVAPVSMADPNEKHTGGGLVIAKHGKGNFVYTGLVFFRQLPAGVPGAYRLMANLIALPKNNVPAGKQTKNISR
ncbi:PIG-L family deacetylase [Aridibaculum aurantiacum]|uniref:PIG-L family deacetylase n=1 Tax=Aridibaculum aurantiacum TaxID=2810307 RepID=UPI001A96DE57|nr:PIG-L family deacetylase [Aridibaculum aurantiacum]